MAIRKGITIHQYLDDWLMRAGSYQVCLRHTQELVQVCRRLGWIVNLEKSELEPKPKPTNRRLPVRPEGQPGPAYTGLVADPPREDLGDPVSTDLSGPAVYVPDWSANSHRKASFPRPASYEIHTVASQKQLESAGSTGKSHSGTQIPPPSFGFLFIWGFTSLSTLYRSYHDG